MDKIINYISISLTPIASLLISILTFINSTKEKELKRDIDEKISQKNINGDNIQFIDMRKNEMNFLIDPLENKKEKITIQQQNIDYINSIFSKYSFLILIIIYISNLCKLLFPLPDLPLYIFDINRPSIVIFFFTSIFQAFLPTIINILIFISFSCLALALKVLVASFSIKNMFYFIYNICISLIYFYCFRLVKTIPLDSITFRIPSNETFSFINIFNSYIPFIIILLLLVLWFFSLTLIEYLFETDLNRPNIKLFKILFPKLGFYLFLLIIPVLIIFITKYI